MEKFLRSIFIPIVMIPFLTACSGRSDRDGLHSLEGHSDPANNGGALSGDHIHHSSTNKTDSLKIKDSIRH